LIWSDLEEAKLETMLGVKGILCHEIDLKLAIGSNYLLFVEI
jgi:hypothetical protein